jgi:hypothetical protein
MSLIVLAVGAGCLAIAGYAVGVLGRKPCPACGTKLLRRMPWTANDGNRWRRARPGKLFRCESCFAEFVRVDSGTFVARHVWEQGGEGIPPAKLLR